VIILLETNDTTNALVPQGITKNAIIDEEMKYSFLSYAMSVIVSRALPDVRDGLKPVHRRILFAMYEMGLMHNKSFKKSARVVGEVLGKYHPHGDVAVYDSMVRMAQEFSLRYPLVNGQGNFGSIDGDSQAAMRYTEAKLTKLAELLLTDIDKNTVAFSNNYDETLKEPTVLPGLFPNLLVNGSVGIAVGMATNIPPHNMVEVCNAVLALLDNPDLTAADLCEFVHGPDFPTYGIICGRSGIRSAYTTGHGKVIVRSKTHFEDVSGRPSIIIDEVPYQVNKAALIEGIAELVKNKVIEGIHDIRDESNRKGIRVVIELKRDAQQDVILNLLFKHSRMQVTCGINSLCLVNNVPRVLNIQEMLTNFIEHRFDVIRNRVAFDLDKAEKRAHILLGLKVAIENLDKTIQIIRGSNDPSVAKNLLISNFSIDDIQAQAILDLRLQRLTGLERDKLVEEYKQIMQLIAELQSILASKEKIYGIIKSETIEVKEKFGDERRTQITDIELGDHNIEDFIEDEDVVVTITHGGYIKRLPLTTYKAQRRGGKGVIATTTKDEDHVARIFVSHSKSFILFFTNMGQVHWLKVYHIPEGSRQARGRAIVNLLNLSEGERVTAFIPVNDFRSDQFLVLCTKQGVIKKTSLDAYSRPRAGGIHAVKLDEGDELIHAGLTSGQDEFLIATYGGLAARFDEQNVRELGRVSRGVRAIRLEDGDFVIGMVITPRDKVESQSILTITENGYGKRTALSEYRLINRGGKGVINIQTSDRNGQVVSVKGVTDESGILLISRNGISIRTRADQISVIGRNTQGVRIMNMAEGDKVVSCALVVHEDEEAESLVELPPRVLHPSEVSDASSGPTDDVIDSVDFDDATVVDSDERDV
jgi:DNA gyrase subunit A